MLSSINAHALSAPASLKNGRSGLAQQTLGSTCFTFDIAADTLPCNPAYMAKERDRSFKAHLFLGNNVTYLREASDVINGKANAKTIETLFNEKKSSEFEASLEAAYVSETFGIAYEPYRISYYSLFQN